MKVKSLAFKLSIWFFWLGLGRPKSVLLPYVIVNSIQCYFTFEEKTKCICVPSQNDSLLRTTLYLCILTEGDWKTIQHSFHTVNTAVPALHFFSFRMHGNRIDTSASSSLTHRSHHRLLCTRVAHNHLTTKILRCILQICTFGLTQATVKICMKKIDRRKNLVAFLTISGAVV